MLTDRDIEKRFRYRLNKHGMKLHKETAENGKAMYQVIDIDDDPKNYDKESYHWFSFDELSRYVEELAEKEHEE